jgi:glycerophosphoryl diester phosphodiesterase
MAINYSNMTKRLILVVALLVAGGAAAMAQPKVIAHRGYWTAPGSAQNSLTSFTKADEVGVFGSEFDVWLTGDGKLIVNHDRVYEGVDAERATLKEVTAIKLPNGENIPTLDAYLRLAASKPATRVVLEMKSLSDLKREDLAVAKIVKALRKYDLLDRTDIIAFSINACLAFKKLLPDGRIFYLNGDLPPKSIKKLGLTGIDYAMKVLRKHPEWVAQAHKAGLEVNVWTVDKEEDMRYFIDLGVDYITTDYPELLQSLLKK